jgi:proteasome lid subunit RPN8/RPN11
MAVNNMVIECSDQLIKKIEDHCFSETQIEVGGFLVGKIEGNVTTVTHVMRAKKTVGKSTNLTFTHDTWTELYKDIEDLKTESVIIGWYHSHPNFGVFLSEHDKFIQNNYFKADGQITTVVDPIRGRRGWWYSSDEKIVTYGKELDTTRERLGESATDPDANMDAVFEAAAPTGGVSLGKVIAISAAMSLLSFLAGWGVTALNAGSAGSTEAELQSLRSQVQELQIVAGIYGNTPPDKIPTAPIASSKPTKAPSKAATPRATATKSAAAVASKSASSAAAPTKAAAGTNTTASPATSKAAGVSLTAKQGGDCSIAGALGKQVTVDLVCALKAGKLIWVTKAEKAILDKAPKLGAACTKLADPGVANDGTKLTCGKSGTTKKWMSADEYRKSLEAPTPAPTVSPTKNAAGSSTE